MNTTKITKNKRQITLLTLVLALGVAVYLNWQYARGGEQIMATDDILAVSGTVQASEVAQDEAIEVNEVVQEALPDKNYGDAQLVSVNESEEFFEEARLTRGKTRDEALDKLQKSLKESSLTESEKQVLTNELSGVIAAITAESDIENLVKAKGFLDCVAFVDGDKVDVTVKTNGEALNEQSVAIIRDIVLGKTNTTSQNITIVEVQ